MSGESLCFLGSVPLVGGVKVLKSRTQVCGNNCESYSSVDEIVLQLGRSVFPGSMWQPPSPWLESFQARCLPFPGSLPVVKQVKPIWVGTWRACSTFCPILGLWDTHLAH